MHARTLTHFVVVNDIEKDNDCTGVIIEKSGETVCASRHIQGHAAIDEENEITRRSEKPRVGILEEKVKVRCKGKILR